MKILRMHFIFVLFVVGAKSPHQTHSGGRCKIYLYIFILYNIAMQFFFCIFGIAILRCTCMYSFLVMLYFFFCFYFLFGVLDYRCQLPFCGCHIDFSLVFFPFSFQYTADILCIFQCGIAHTYKVVVLSLYI